VNDMPALDALKEHLQLLRPQVIVALPSYVAALAAARVDLSSYGVEAITTNSEQSLPQERRQYERQFGMPVRDEYSSVELEQIAFECSHGRYHVFEDNVYVETIDTDERGVGAIVGTSLCATHMPMIRYNQGDLGVLATRPCPCGAHTRALEHIHGRRNASFVTRDGRVVPSASILGIVDDFLVRSGSGVETYRLYQTSVDELTLYHTGSPLCTDVRAMTQQLERLLGRTLALEARHVDRLPQQGSYKRQLLVSLVGEPPATTHSRRSK
jgi:phenylacetate-CoA ligase